MELNQLQHISEELSRISIEVGKYILEARDTEISIDEKAFNNLVTEVDKNAEKQFVEALEKLLPEAGFITEEGTKSNVADVYNWVIDPLDGTTNYVHRIPAYCTSVALLKNNEPIISCIFNPSFNELFSAVKDAGAFLNGIQISVSKTDSLAKCLLATGFPYDDFEYESSYFKILQNFTHATRGLRRLGSAAIDLAYVACGRFDSFYEYGLNPWDVAAGVLLVNEAGGACTDFSGKNNVIFGEQIVASTPAVHKQMLNIIQNDFK
jgi:myo-inositol-1(or 4)-monophosphatase